MPEAEMKPPGPKTPPTSSIGSDQTMNGHRISAKKSTDSLQALNEMQNLLTAGPENLREYQELYNFSVQHPEAFWELVSRRFTWKKKPGGNILQYNFEWTKGPVYVKWMESAETNICYNCLDLRIEQGNGDKVAFYWEGNDIDEQRTITYRELLQRVCKFANVLKSKGVGKGDRVTIYMPMIIELVEAMLACARIGAVHNVVFGGFSTDSLAERILDSKSTVLITADGTWRGTKLIRLKDIADGALDKCLENNLDCKCLVVRHLEETLKRGDRPMANDNQPRRVSRLIDFDFELSWAEGRDEWLHEAMANASPTCEVEWVKSEHPLFILYTSGSTGKPKGVLHTTGGYMLYTALTFQNTFAYKPGDIYFCTADIGWITGHSYGVYGPLLNGSINVMFNGIPTHPDPGRYWDICAKYKVTKFYTSPTAIRSLMKFDKSYATRYNLDSLLVLGTVGEPINPEAWQWYNTVIGGGRCDIVDTYWQSETGGHVITPLPGITPLKPGSATLPFYGIVPALLNDYGQEIHGPGKGHLVFKQPWPGMTRGVYGDPQRFASTYFSKFPGYYCTGDGARRDNEGYYFITGRTDDMLNVSGHLLSTAEVESALSEHDACVEAAAIAYPHAIKGECLYCYVVLKDGVEPSQEVISELKRKVRTKIGTFATPEFIHFSPGLPKTRSGKVMRRVLRKISIKSQEFGDLSSLADHEVLYQLTQSKPMLTAE